MSSWTACICPECGQWYEWSVNHVCPFQTVGGATPLVTYPTQTNFHSHCYCKREYIEGKLHDVCCMCGQRVLVLQQPTTGGNP